MTDALCQVSHAFSKGTFDGQMKYLLYSPEEKVIANQTKAPLLLFLHGGGESGDDLEKVKRHGPPKLIAQGKKFPFYVLAPQNPYPNGFWDDRVVEKLLQHIIDSLSIDTTRIYLAGMSRGGYGAWRLAINNPDTFAAIVSVCAASIPTPYLSKVSHVPTRFFHGLLDDLIPASQSISAYQKMKAEGADVAIKLFPEAKHDSWTETFNNDHLYDWLLLQNKH